MRSSFTYTEPWVGGGGAIVVLTVLGGRWGCLVLLIHSSGWEVEGGLVYNPGWEVGEVLGGRWDEV